MLIAEFDYNCNLKANIFRGVQLLSMDNFDVALFKLTQF